ncbi:uncharacterized protein LOC129601457 [Paramacrobiotus metropolitanus]|uniref:uncharacterized protein LOC129601457 n=1 Tax=Paramacrobiotus metropolitanus TaxID=2943436 RepID=UPI00244593BE|nr:uncharacterized protein LOC129601457 [Paramacrobiotus metropolitanus]
MFVVSIVTASSSGALSGPNKFPPKEPRYFQHRIGPDVYRHREAVFAPSCSGDWNPAEVVDTARGDIVVRWCRHGHRSGKGPREVVRAADILQRGQLVQCWGDTATYCMRRGGKHLVEGIDGREMAVNFADLMILDTVVSECKATNQQLRG